MELDQVVKALDQFAAWAIAVLAFMVGLLIVLGLLNGAVVMYRTLASRRARAEMDQSEGPLPQGFVSMYTYLHLLADVLLVLVAVELMETLIAFENRANPEEYLSGVIGAALVALARRIIVFFNPEASDIPTAEMYAYAALVAALAFAYAVIGYLA